MAHHQMTHLNIVELANEHDGWKSRVEGLSKLAPWRATVRAKAAQVLR